MHTTLSRTVVAGLLAVGVWTTGAVGAQAAEDTAPASGAVSSAPATTEAPADPAETAPSEAATEAPTEDTATEDTSTEAPAEAPAEVPATTGDTATEASAEAPAATTEAPAAAPAPTSEVPVAVPPVTPAPPAAPAPPAPVAPPAAPPAQLDVQVTASIGCDALVFGTVTVAGLTAGQVVDITAAGLTDQVVADETGVVLFFVQSEPAGPAIDVLVAVDGAPVFAQTVPTPDVCTGTGTVSVDRDCATPDTLLARVSVTGLTDGLHSLVLNGADGEVAIGLFEVVGGGFTGDVELTSLLGTLPAGAFEAEVRAVDETRATVPFYTVVTVASCPVAAPAPVQPIAPVPPVTHPVAPAPHPAPAPAPVAHPAPAAASDELAYTGSPVGGLALLGGLLVGSGAVATVVARRRVA
ncbi:hypothetical protein [Goekera deserti]|uniref:Gram-positive cocci surface proteins LPxTG domain-containing protein n=1 Tax=Goekera deserti TaxID=2497753 RepID=A0A7K3WC24_9ACTN|nr:hypothetical protein [Goekera deserti]NDI48269.1 hypothetical protein [Goekera deserti]NEL54018.1 hypothetical protein [Goekera deserti]